LAICCCARIKMFPMCVGILFIIDVVTEPLRHNFKATEGEIAERDVATGVGNEKCCCALTVPVDVAELYPHARARARIMQTAFGSEFLVMTKAYLRSGRLRVEVGRTGFVRFQLS